MSGYIPPAAPVLVSPDIDIPTFRATLREFKDSGRWLDDDIILLMNVATASLDPRRWGEKWRLGVCLFIAHNLVLMKRAEAEVTRGGIPGGRSGVVTSKSMGGVSVSFDGSFALSNGGEWNLTTYGIRFLTWARMIGSGGVQVSGFLGPAYPGQPPFPILGA